MSEKNQLMNSPSEFLSDVCVIGRGLLGSAAARHLSEMGVNVSLLGPDEPSSRSQHSGVFGSHYDSGRITRIIDTDFYCGQIARGSLSRYRDFENSSCVNFFRPVRHLAVSHVNDYISEITHTANCLEVDFQSLTSSELANAFPYFSFTDEVSGLYEISTGGYVDPRSLIRAQNAMLVKNGGEIFTDTASRVESYEGYFQVFTEDGTQIKAENVLVASGVFSGRIIDSIPKLDVTICESTVVFAELDESDVVELQQMPSVIFKQGHEVEKGVYVLPPIQYPDQKTYLKIGHSESRPMSDPDTNLIKWFQGKGDPVVAEWLESQLFSLMPSVSFKNIETESCAVSRSSTGKQFIDRIDESGIHVLLAGNGYSAKSSDELGRIAAHKIIFGEVPEEYSDIDFRVKYKRT